jgi:hypothetical protein
VKDRTASRLAWSVWAACVAAALVYVAFELVRGHPPPTTARDAWGNAQEAFGAVVFSTVGAIVASRRRDNTIAWLFLAIGASFGLSAVASALSDTFAFRSATWQWGIWLNTWSWVPGWFAMVTFVFLLFPDGHLPAGRWRWVGWLAAIGIGVSWLGGIFNPSAGGTVGYQSPFPTLPLAVTENGAVPLGFLLSLVAAIGSIAALVRRFRRSAGDERQQMKWFVYAAVATLLLTPERTVWAMNVPVLQVLGLASIAVLPVAVGVAVLKYRLYDVDVVINKTLVYGVLSGVLAAVYAGLVLVLGSLARSLGGSTQSPLIVAASTLTAAALFRPLRHRVQAMVDRRFYRRRYDAQRTLEAFGGRLRDKVDLDELSGYLLATVRETVQPSNAWLWLRIGGGGVP